MFDFIKRKIARHKRKRTFSEYGYTVNSFEISEYEIGKVEYAQWNHPSESQKVLNDSIVRFYGGIIDRGSMVIDIGAHTGDTTVPMALVAGKNGLVLALEPNQYVFKILQKNSSLNVDNTNIIPLCFAATSEDGEFEFNYSDASYCNGGFLSQNHNKRHHHNFTLKVKGVNLERYLFEYYSEDLSRLSLIKIDAEGYDAKILQSLQSVVTTYKPALLIECYKLLSTEERSHLYDLIDGYGYDLYYIQNFNDNAERIKLEKKNMNDRRHFDMLAIRKQPTAGQ